MNSLFKPGLRFLVPINKSGSISYFCAALIMEFGRLLSTGFLVLCVLGVGGKELQGSAPCGFPAIYNFGDSNSDTRGISAAFDPIPAPYGEAFFHKPAGRDSDGRVLLDFIGTNISMSLSFSRLKP